MAAVKTGVGTHYRRYATANALVMVAGLVSFPVFTRLLDNAQYGILGYYDTWVLMAVAIGKLGAQHAILRFYPHDGGPARLRAFTSSLFYLPLMISLALWALVASALVGANLLRGLDQQPVFWLALVAVPLFVFFSQVATLLRATENSKLLSATRIGWRWLELLLMVGAVVALQRSAFAAYGGKVAAAAVVIAFCVYWVRRNLAFSRADIDWSTFREGLIYGLPLVATEVIAVALVSIDRLMIKSLTGDFATLGIYTIGTGLAMQVHTFMNLTIFEAFAPTANRVYFTEGAQAVRMLKARMLMPMTYAATGIAALLLCFGTDLIIALSGRDKAASGQVLAIAGAVCALQPLLLLAGYGLLLERRSTKVLVLMCGTLLVNVALNLLWIPAHGYMGAVYANLVSSSVLAIGHCLWVPRALLQLPDLRTTVVALVSALAATGVALASDQFESGWPRLLAGGTTLAGLYVIAVLALDARMRGQLVQQWRAHLDWTARPRG